MFVLSSRSVWILFEYIKIQEYSVCTQKCRYVCVVVLFQYIDIAIYRFKQARDAASISKLRTSIQRNTGSKVDYFTCIFNELVARAFSALFWMW